MRIAIIGSVSSPIPPVAQAAVERLVYETSLGLANKGHEIILFALSGSKISHPKIKLVEIGRESTLSGSGREDSRKNEAVYGTSYKLRLEVVHLSRVLEKLIELKDSYDVILNNVRGEAVLVPLAKLLNKPIYHVVHLPIFPELEKLFFDYKTPIISISNAQRKANPSLNFAATVYNAVDTNEFAFSPEHKNYLLYLGSIGANKNPKDAILAAKKAGETLLLGGRIKDQAYYDKEIASLIDGTQIKWVGEMHPNEVIALYQGAKAFLFPTLWEEPFGLVMIEAMSCGTPVIAYPNGAVPEIVIDGKNGFLARNVDEMAEKIKEIGRIDRKVCRAVVEEKFSIPTMVNGYEKVLGGQP